MDRGFRIHQALLQLSDPRAEKVDSANLELSTDQWQQLFALAGVHGVMGIILHNLRTPCRENNDSWEMAERCVRAKVVQTLRVRRYGANLIEKLTAAGVPAALFKGIDFADHLYPRASQRTTSDIDLLVPHNRWSEAAEVLQGLEYIKDAVPPMRFAASDYGEETWRHRSAADIEVDLHWNLINHPTLRRRASIEYDNLDWEIVGPQAPGQVRATPATRLVIAAAHAAFGHQFDRLLMLCDIREACRQLTDATDISNLRKMIARTGIRAAMDVALGTTARWFNDPCSADLQRHQAGRTMMLGGSRLISKKMLLCSGGQGHWLRRRLLRELLKRAA